MIRRAAWLIVLAAACGCTLPDENPDWNPKADYPAWAYDAPFYYRPTEELRPLETVGNGIPICYTRSEYFFIRHPGGCQPVGEPRVGVWCSTNEGKNWDKAGYFGVEQAHFLFQADTDGRYWIRFSGPAQGVTKVPPGMPHRIYVVDRNPPGIVVTVDPPPWDNRDRKVPHTYRVGDAVTVRWTVTDAAMAPGSVKLSTCFAEFPNNLIWSRFPESLPPTGSLTVELPPECLQDGGMRFHVEAADKAGNVGVGMTEVLTVAGRPGQAVPSTQPVVQPVGPLVPAADEAPPASLSRLGWPEGGEFLRGGAAQVLNWAPPTAQDYPTLELHFTANDGDTWRTVAGGFKPGEVVKWTVPEVSSKNCRLRLAATSKAGQRIALAQSGRFTVDIVTVDMKTTPEPIVEEP